MPEDTTYMRTLRVTLNFLNGCRTFEIAVGDVWYIQDPRVTKDKQAVRIVNLTPDRDPNRMRDGKEYFLVEALWSGRERLMLRSRFNEKRGGLARQPLETP
jgi:hypothetical protein